MLRNGASSVGASARRAKAPARRLAAAIIVAAAALCPIGPAAAEDVTPFLSPDRVEDVPSTKADPFPAFANFAWRAFVALNLPSLLDPADRGVPDRARSPGDPGPRVWETFKSRYELFQIAPDGRPLTPSPCASDHGPNPCGADVDNR